MGFLQGGELVAGVVYHNWVPENGVIEISSAALRCNWLNKARLSAIFGYPFEQVQCRMVVARIAESNATARRIWRSIGASEYLIPQLRSHTEAEAIYTLSKEQWQGSKFMRAINGQAGRARAA